MHLKFSVSKFRFCGKLRLVNTLRKRWVVILPTSVVTHGTVGCRCDNLRCHQGRQNWHHDNSRSLRWRHNGRDSVSNHQPHDFLLNRLFRHRSKKTSTLRVAGLCAGNSPQKRPVTRKMFPFDDVIMCQWLDPSVHKCPGATRSIFHEHLLSVSHLHVTVGAFRYTNRRSYRRHCQ